MGGGWERGGEVGGKYKKSDHKSMPSAGRGPSPLGLRAMDPADKKIGGNIPGGLGEQR